jgi:catechol 2,3-dioxygenase-like lactoylglutathione lyase family enzyme
MSQITGICHVGIYSPDPHALAAFYHDVLGMEIVGGSGPDHPVGATAFLSSRPGEEDHEIAIFANASHRHLAFRVESLTALRASYRTIRERGLPIKLSFNHGASLAFYFDDPAGNMIEVYWATGVAYPQPYASPIDLGRSEVELLGEVALLADKTVAPPLASPAAV